MITKRFLFVIVLFLSFQTLQAQDFEWAGRMGGADTSDYGISIAVDHHGNVYTTGYFEGTADFDPGAGTYNLTSAGGIDIFVSKLDASGNFVWALRMGGTNSDAGKSISVDTSGNVYTTGYFSGTADFDPGAGTYNLTSAGWDDIFVSKLDASGNFAWAKQMGGTESDWGKSICVDASGNVYTTGLFSGTADFDPGAGIYNLTSAGSDDIFVSKLDASGNFAWAKQMGGTELDRGYSIRVDTSGNIFTTGRFSGTVDFDPGADTFYLTSVFTSAFVSKLDASGDFIWAKKMEGINNANAYTLALDDPSNFVRAKQRGFVSIVIAYALALDDSSNVYTSGIFSKTADFDPGADTFNLTSAGESDIFVSKLDASGNFVWAKRMGGTNQEWGYSIQVDTSGNVYTTGFFLGTVDFDPGADTFNLTSAGNWDIFVSKLDASGNFSWAGRMGGTNDDWCNSLAIDSSGNVYTTGFFEGTADFDPGADTFNLTSAGGQDIFVQKMNLCVSTGEFDTTACDSYTVPSGDETYTESGTYYDTIPNAAGCDSLLTINLTIYESTTSEFDTTACDSYTVPSGDETYTESGTYYDTIPNAAGCDSLMTINLTIYESTTSEFDTTTCDFYTVPSGDETYTESGTYYDTIPNAAGCDSIITIYLTIDTVDVSVTVDNETLIANATDATFQWLDCENDYAVIPGETDSSFTPLENGTYAVEVTQNNCTDTSICIPVVNVGMFGTDLDGISIYPNPTDGMIYIDLGSIKGVTIKVFNISGQPVYQKTNIRTRVYQFAFKEPPGIYIFEISAQGEKRRFKLVKE